VAAVAAVYMAADIELSRLGVLMPT